MKIIHQLIDHINEELDGAKDYAEKYIHNRAIGNNSRANIYRQMAMDELTHASNVHDFAVQDIEAIRSVHTLSDECEEKITHAMKHYAECVAKVKYMVN